MNSITTFIHVTGSSRNIGDDLPFLHKILQAVYNSQAMVSRNWIEAAHQRRRLGVEDEEVDWSHVFQANTEAIQRSDLVIVEATQSRFSQGYQTYVSMQHKKPTLIVTRSQIEGLFISGIANKYITTKVYSNEEELESIVTKFIKQNTVLEKDLRLNMTLDRRTYKFLRDRSYETGKNKSEIVRAILAREQKRREDLI